MRKCIGYAEFEGCCNGYTAEGGHLVFCPHCESLKKEREREEKVASEDETTRCAAGEYREDASAASIDNAALER